MTDNTFEVEIKVPANVDPRDVSVTVGKETEVKDTKAPWEDKTPEAEKPAV